MQFFKSIAAVLDGERKIEIFRKAFEVVSQAQAGPSLKDEAASHGRTKNRLQDDNLQVLPAEVPSGGFWKACAFFKDVGEFLHRF